VEIGRIGEGAQRVVSQVHQIEDAQRRQPTPEEVYELIRREVKEVNKSLVIYKYVKDFTLREQEFAKTTTKKIKRYAENK
jgi:long-chain acyl-CoA synthetase